MILAYTPKSTDLPPNPVLLPPLPLFSSPFSLLSLPLNDFTNKALQQIRSCLQTIGDLVMAIIGGIGRILTAIVNGIVRLCGILVSFLTCGYCGSKGGRTKRRGHSHMRTTRV
jgi:uncharacterized membrane protein YuzA (DUF378 family)